MEVWTHEQTSIPSHANDASFRHQLKLMSLFRRLRAYLSGLFTNPYLWAGLTLLVGLMLGAYLLVDEVIMPSYTRHDASVTVPSVKTQTFQAATQQLREKDLQVEKDKATYSPNAPRNVVIEQSPRPGAVVKPGRRVYLTINTGEAPMVQVPPVEDLSRREARNRIMAVGLTVADVRPDSIPAPYENTITRQRPAPGDSLEKGGAVTLWYSTGLGDERVSVPDVTNLTVAAARDTLLGRQLRSVVVNRPEDASKEQVAEMKVQRQSQRSGARVRRGSEVRLFLKEKEDDGESEEPPTNTS